MATTLSDYQCDCANPNAVKTPQTYKQGPVVRLDKDVRDVKKWLGTDDPKGAASMDRDTRTALRDKVADYQKKNGIQAQVPGELNKDTLDKMRQDKTLPQGLTDSLEKVKPYYKPEGIARAICVTPPANGMGSAEPARPMASKPRTLESYGLSDGKGLDIDRRKLPETQQESLATVTRMVQKQMGDPQTGVLDKATIERMKQSKDPAAREWGEQAGRWKKDGLISDQGVWNVQRDREIRAEVEAQGAVAKAKGPATTTTAKTAPSTDSGITNLDPAKAKREYEAAMAGKQGDKPAGPVAGTSGPNGLQTLEWRIDLDKIRGGPMHTPYSNGGPGAIFMRTGSGFNDPVKDGGLRASLPELQPSFEAAKVSPVPLEVSARTRVAEAAVQTLTTTSPKQQVLGLG